MATARLTEAEIKRQYRAARALEVAERKEGKRAQSGTFDPRSRRIIVELSNGCLFGFPVSAIPGLGSATDEELARVETSGVGLHWESLDVDLSVPGLLMSTIGRSWKLSELARVAGQTKSPAKAAAARRNGSKGGRPRKKATRNRR